MMGQKQTRNHADVSTKGIRVGHGSKPQQVARLDSFVEKISSVTILIETALPNSDFMDVWQSGKRSGGVAVFFFKNVFQGKQMSLGDCSSFEYIQYCTEMFPQNSATNYIQAIKIFRKLFS